MPAAAAPGSVSSGATRELPRAYSRNLGTFDDQIGEIDVGARLRWLRVLPLGPLFSFQLLALALGLLALTFDDGYLWPAHKPPHNEKGRIAPALSSIAISAT